MDMLIAWGDGAHTVITATHDLGLVEDIADPCVLLYQGQVGAEGEPAVLLGDQALLARTNYDSRPSPPSRHGRDPLSSAPPRLD